METRRGLKKQTKPYCVFPLAPHLGKAPPGLQGYPHAKQGLRLPIKWTGQGLPPTSQTGAQAPRPPVGGQGRARHMSLSPSLRGQDTPRPVLGLRASLGSVAQQPSAPSLSRTRQEAPTLHHTWKAPSDSTGNHHCPGAQRPGSPQGPAPRCPPVSTWPSAGLRC